MVDLAVELYGQRIGTLSGENHRAFDIALDESAIDRFGASSRIMSMAVPLDVMPTRSNATRRRNFFAGLLPEGRQLTSMARNAKLTEFDTLGLLARYGRDVAGAIQIWDDTDPGEPRTPKAEPITDAGVSALLADLAAQPLGNARQGGKTSLPGVQPKVLLALGDSGWAQVFDGYPSTHILKPVVDEYPTMIFDEEYGSRFARALGLAQFDSTLQQFDGTNALVIERYDRGADHPGGRIHQEDMAQALGVPTNEKYERHGSVTLERISRLLDETDESRPRMHLAKMLTLSVALGNLDMHAKNISLLHTIDGEVSIAPMYDVVPQTQYDTDGEFAFSINGNRDFESITRADIINEMGKWGYRGAAGVVDETLEAIRDLARHQAPHPSANPKVQDSVLRYATNLLEGRATGASA